MLVLLETVWAKFEYQGYRSVTERGGAMVGRGGAFVVVAGCVVSVRLSSLFS